MNFNPLSAIKNIEVMLDDALMNGSISLEDYITTWNDIMDSLGWDDLIFCKVIDQRWCDDQSAIE